jgi:hypothetical protein
VSASAVAATIPRVDAYRLGFMLFASLSTTLLGLLPATLAGLSPGER